MDISFVRKGITIPKPKLSGPMVDVPSPRTATLLMCQEAGKICAPLVEVGDRVTVGQKVARGQAHSGVIHTPVSGEIKSFGEILLADNTHSQTIVIESDGKDAREVPEPPMDPLKETVDGLLERIREGGVLRRGQEPRSLADVIEEARSPRGFLGATGSAIARPVEHLVVRCVDQDPYLGTLEAVTASLADDATDVGLGIRVLAKITGAVGIHLILEKRQKAPGIEKLADENDYGIARLNACNYPSLSDPLVARTVSGKEIEVAFKRVHESGVFIVDIDTLLEVVAAVRDDMPVIEKILTVCGPQGSKVLRAKIGTPLDEIAKIAGQQGDIGKVIIGGPMRGAAHHTLAFPLTKNTEGLTLLERAEVATATNDPCISCGLCAEVCPMRLIPGMLSRYCEFGAWDLADQAHLFSCIECGCCAHVCPAGRSIVQFVVQGKSEVIAMRGGKDQ